MKLMRLRIASTLLNLRDLILGYLRDKTIMSLLIILVFVVLDTFYYLTAYLIDYFNIAFEMLGPEEIMNSSLYTCSALIQAYAALVAIIYSLTSTHLQSRYGNAVVYVLVKNLVKPIIVLILFTLDSIFIMVMNSSLAIPLETKHFFLFIVEPLAFIISLIFLYTNVISTTKLRPYKIVEELMDPKQIERIMEKASHAVDIREFTSIEDELDDRISGSFTILYTLLEDPSKIDECDIVLGSMEIMLRRMNWEKIRKHRLGPHVFYVIIDEIKRKFLAGLSHVRERNAPLPSPEKIAYFLEATTIMCMYVGGNLEYYLHEYVQAIEEITRTYMYTPSYIAPNIIQLEMHPEALSFTHVIVLSTIQEFIEKRGQPLEESIIKGLIKPLIDSAERILEQLENEITSLHDQNKRQMYLKHLQRTKSELEKLTNELAKYIPQLKK